VANFCVMNCIVHAQSGYRIPVTALGIIFFFALYYCSLHRFTMKRTAYKSRIFPCHHKCGFYGKTPAGVTRHKYTCAKNPQNCYLPSENSSTNLEASPPRTPSPGPLGGDPHTPRNSDRWETPQHSPRRFHWTTDARGVRTHLHPHLNGQLLLFVAERLTE